MNKFLNAISPLRPNVRPGVKTFFVPRISNIMGLLFGLRSLFIYNHIFLMSVYKEELLFHAIDEIKVSLIFKVNRVISIRLFLLFN